MIVATPSMPVEVYGISGVPMAGDEFIAVPDEKTANRGDRISPDPVQKWEERNGESSAWMICSRRSKRERSRISTSS